MIPDDKCIYFHVSAKNSCETTSAARFAENIFWAMGEMKRVFEESLK